MDQIARCTLEPQPENIRTQWDADGFGEDVHKSSLGKARDFGESLEGEIIRDSNSLSKVLNDAQYFRMNSYRRPSTKQFHSRPPVDTPFAQILSKFGAPACQLVRGNRKDVAFYLLVESRAQTALDVNKGDQNWCLSRIDLMYRIWSHQCSATCQPSISATASDAKGAFRRHNKLDAVMTMSSGSISRPPYDHCR